MKPVFSLAYDAFTRILICAAVIGAFLHVSTSPVSAAATVYANSSTGNDSTGNGTSGSPYLTFHQAYTAAASGDTIDLTGTFTWSDAGESGDAA